MSWNSSSSLGACCTTMDGLTIMVSKPRADYDEYGVRSLALSPFTGCFFSRDSSICFAGAGTWFHVYKDSGAR